MQNSINTIAIFPGTFDPVTKGHVNIVERASSFLPKIIVGVLDNPSKNPLLLTEDRVKLLKLALSHLGDRVEVLSFSGLLVEFAKEKKANIIVRGLRAISDFDYETQLALVNKKLNPELETIFMPSTEKFSYTSSSVVRQVAQLGGDISAFVPDTVIKPFLELIKR